MSDEEMRAAFEAWVSGPPYELDTERTREGSKLPGIYLGYDTHLAWEAWQEATRQAEQRMKDRADELP